MTRTRTHGLLVIALPMVSLLALTISAIALDYAERGSEAAANRYQEIRSEVELLMIGLLDSEAGVRGYLLTADGRFLDPYLRSQATMPVSLDRLATLVEGDPELRDRFGDVRDKALARSLALSDLRRRGATGDELVAELVNGKRGTDALRASLATMLEIGNHRVVASNARRDRVHAQQRWALMLALVVGLGGGAAASWWFLKWVEATMTQIKDLYDGAPCGYHTADANTIIREVNQTELRLLGRTRDEVVGHRLVELVTPQSREHILANYEPFARTGRLEDLDIDIVAGDGSIRPVSLTATALYDAAGAYAGSRSTLFDITERRRAEVARHELTRQLDRALTDQRLLNQELEAFSYSVAHDLRSPLRSLDGYSQALLEDYGEQLDDTARHYLTRLRVGAQRMARLIDDLLNLARVSRATVDRRPVDIAQVAASVREDLCEAEPQREVTWVIDAPLDASTDPVLIRVLLQNLLGNAFKFTAKREGACITVGREIVDGMPAFFVRDNGAGFDMQYAAKLFGIFQRLHTEQEFAGTGVGLATVQRIVHKHGGRVWANGAPGEGATFWFTLPTSEESR